MLAELASELDSRVQLEVVFRNVMTWASCQQTAVSLSSVIVCLCVPKQNPNNKHDGFNWSPFTSLNALLV